MGPFDPDFVTPIRTAATLLLQNLEQGRIDKREGVVLLTSAPYRSKSPNFRGFEPAHAMEKSDELARQALRVIRRDVPSLMQHLQVLRVTTDLSTRKIYPFDALPELPEWDG